MFDTRDMRETLEQLTTDTMKLAATRPWSLTDTELIDSIGPAYRHEQAAAAVTLHLVREIEARGIPAAERFGSTAGWLRSRLRIDPGPARERVVAATALDRRPALDDALCTGQVDVRQATAIANALDDLPAEVGDETITAAERRLIGFAGEFEPNRLRKLGGRILQHVAPEIADRIEREQLERAEARAHAKRSFTLGMPQDGRVMNNGPTSAGPSWATWFSSAVNQASPREADTIRRVPAALPFPVLAGRTTPARRT